MYKIETREELIRRIGGMVLAEVEEWDYANLRAQEEAISNIDDLW